MSNKKCGNKTTTVLELMNGGICLIKAYADVAGTDQPAPLHSLIIAFDGSLLHTVD